MAYNLKSFTGFEKNNSIECFRLDGLLWGRVEMNVFFSLSVGKLLPDTASIW